LIEESLHEIPLTPAPVSPTSIATSLSLSYQSQTTREERKKKKKNTYTPPMVVQVNLNPDVSSQKKKKKKKKKKKTPVSHPPSFPRKEDPLPPTSPSYIVTSSAISGAYPPIRYPL
jgi:hypothetical protein